MSKDECWLLGCWGEEACWVKVIKKNSDVISDSDLVGHIDAALIIYTHADQIDSP